jgi:hypothetical protein
VVRPVAEVLPAAAEVLRWRARGTAEVVRAVAETCCGGGALAGTGGGAGGAVVRAVAKVLPAAAEVCCGGAWGAAARGGGRPSSWVGLRASRPAQLLGGLFFLCLM